MHIGLIATPTEQRYYTDAELECWRNLHILRYQIQFQGKFTVNEFLQLENVRYQHNGLLFSKLLITLPQNRRNRNPHKRNSISPLVEFLLHPRASFFN